MVFNYLRKKIVFDIHQNRLLGGMINEEEEVSRRLFIRLDNKNALINSLYHRLIGIGDPAESISIDFFM